MPGANDRNRDSDLLDVLSMRVMVSDGAMATRPQGADAAESNYVRPQSG